MATRHLQKHFWLLLCLPPCSEGGERRRGENRLLCTCRAPDHMQTPQSWTSRLLISALHSVCWREGKREEKDEEERRERGRQDRRRKEQERKRERARKREKERNKTPTHHTPHNTTTTQHTKQHNTQLITQHNTLLHPHNTQHHHTPQHLGQPTMILRVFVNARICAHQSTDRDLEGVST